MFCQQAFSSGQSNLAIPVKDDAIACRIHIPISQEMDDAIKTIYILHSNLPRIGANHPLCTFGWGI
jgi:hypothetical protein